MDDDEVCYDDDNEFRHIIIKHGLRVSFDDPTKCAFELSGEASDLVREMLAARGWSIFRIRRQIRMAIDMLIDAERLTTAV